MKHKFKYNFVVLKECKIKFQAAKRAGCGVLSKWAPIVKNHLYYCAKSCKGDALVLKVFI